MRLATFPKISPFLGYDTQAEEAARFCVSIFPDSRLVGIARYGAGGPRPAGSVVTVAFELSGKKPPARRGARRRTRR